MKKKEYRTWRIIILIVNILIHLSIFLSLTNFKISNLKRRFPSYLEIASFSEGKGLNPNLAGTAVPKESKIEQIDIKREEKQSSDPQHILRSITGGVEVFNDSAQNKSKADTVKNANVNGLDARVNDTLNLQNITATQPGNGVGDGSGTGTLSDVHMPLFLGKDPQIEFNNYAFKQFKLTNENFNGSVLVEFLVNTNGDITDITISNCDNNKVKAEILRIMKSSPRWTPGKQRNRPVPLNYSLVFNIYGY